jgi:hypothetical protein
MRTNGVGPFGWKRWCNSTAHKDWTAASLDAAMMFWIIMVVMIDPDMRHLISHTKKGFHRTAADGIKSFEIALPLLITRLKSHGYYLDRDPTAEELYHFMHAYVNDHMSPAEFDAFFGEGSCAYGGAYVVAMFDALFYGISAAESVQRTYVAIGNRYVEQAEVLATLEANSGRGVVRIKLEGSLLDIHKIPAQERTVSYSVDGPFDVKTDMAANLFLGLVFEKVHAVACPISRVARELKADLLVKICPTSGSAHITSDTFFGLRIIIDIPQRPVPSVMSAKELRKSLRSQRSAQKATTRETVARVHALRCSFSF